MGEKKWTAQQQRAIDERGRNLLVSAAAGSGKTAVLSERVAKLVEGGTDLESMLIITFTTAAAAEMRSRIFNVLEERRKTIPNVPDPLFTKTHISTFSSLALDIYKQYYHVINVPPGLSVCDEYKQNILKKEALDEMFEELFEKEDTDFKDFLVHNCSPRSNEAARQMILELHRFIQSMPDPFGWLDRVETGEFLDPEKLMAEASSDVEDKLREAAGCLEQSSGLLRDPKIDGVDPFPDLAEKIEDYCGRVRGVLSLFEHGEADRAVPMLSELAAEKMESLSPGKQRKDSFALISEEVKAYREDAKKSVKEAAAFIGGTTIESLKKENALLLEQLRMLCALTKDFSARYDKKKLAKGLMDFSDADHYALRILEDPGVQEELRSAFEYIFVDEYQDCNYVQEELVKRISRGNNVFMVGDVKQSIYKFRLAEPEIFIQKYKTFSAGEEKDSEVIDLNMNFRSKSPVIEFVNSVFGAVMTERTVGLKYDSRSMLTGGPSADLGPLYQPELHLISKKVSGDSEADGEIAELKQAELEAINAADIIKKYHGKPVSSGSGTAPLKYSDMAVQMRSAKGRAETFHKIFTEMGVPAFLAGGEGYFDTPEIQIFLNFLRVTDNPAQDVPLISAMHFSGSGFTAEELARIRLESGTDRRSPYYEAVRSFAAGAGGDSTDPLAVKTAAFLEKLSGWRKAAAALPLADLISRMLSESGVADFAAALTGGRQRMANLRSMADRAEAFEQESAEGIGGFVAYMELLASKESVGTGQASVLSEADDVVRIMTVHKSKGLEFPFVLLTGMGSSGNGGRDSSTLRLHKDMGASLRLKDVKTGITAVPLSSRLIEQRRKREDLAEEIRILYVALTRAKDILVMSAVVDRAGEYARSAVSRRNRLKSYLNMVYDALPAKNVIIRDRESFVPAEDDPRRADVEHGIRCGFSVDKKALPITMEELRARLGFRYEPDPEELLKRKYSVSEISELAAGRLIQNKGGLRTPGGASDAIAKGNAYHKVMEQIPFEAAGKSAPEIADFIEKLKEKNILSEKEASLVEPERVAAFFASELGQRALASDEIHRESPFILRTDLDGRNIIVQGVIDCYFREGDSYVLLDYKSSYIDPRDPQAAEELLAERYAMQLELYGKALESIGGMPVSGAYLYLFGSGSWVGR